MEIETHRDKERRIETEKEGKERTQGDKRLIIGRKRYKDHALKFSPLASCLLRYGHAHYIGAEEPEHLAPL